MDQVNQNQMPPVSPYSSPIEPRKKSYGALIAVIVILLVIVVGGLYFLGQRMSQTPYTLPTDNSDSITASQKSQGTSDDLQSIQADLNATDFNNLDQGAAALEAEIQ
jgi:hypothetical protein